MEFPDFHIPHAEKIEWMIETNGWALEPVTPRADTDPPTPAYAYTIGVTELVGFPEIAVFGLTPVASNGSTRVACWWWSGGRSGPWCTGTNRVGACTPRSTPNSAA